MSRASATVAIVDACYEPHRLATATAPGRRSQPAGMVEGRSERASEKSVVAVVKDFAALWKEEERPVKSVRSARLGEPGVRRPWYWVSA